MRFISRSNALGRAHYVTSRPALHRTNSAAEPGMRPPCLRLGNLLLWTSRLDHTTTAAFSFFSLFMKFTGCVDAIVTRDELSAEFANKPLTKFYCSLRAARHTQTANNVNGVTPASRLALLTRFTKITLLQGNKTKFVLLPCNSVIFV